MGFFLKVFKKILQALEKAERARRQSMGVEPIKPLKGVAEAFRDLAATIGKEDMKVASYSNACSQLVALFGCLGFAFIVAEQDLKRKVNDIATASSATATLSEMIDADKRANTVRTGGSHTRNLLRVNRGLEMTRILFKDMINTKGDSMEALVLASYEKSFGPYHSQAIKGVIKGTLAVIPTRVELISMVNEDDDSATAHMQIYVDASEPVIKYINDLFDTKGLGIDW